MIFWFDLETTGVDPRTCSILEVGLIVTPDQHKQKILGKYRSVVKTDQSVLDNMNDWCKKTHTASGLIEDVKKHGKDLKIIEQGLVRIAKEFCPDKKNKPILAGYSVHFDKSFVEVHMPEFHSLLDFRIIDVSSMREALRREHGFSLPYEQQGVAHRVIADIEASMRDYGKYMELLKPNKA